MNTMDFTRRQFLKGTGALIVSFNLFPPLDLWAQTTEAEAPDPTQLDSWITVHQDGTVTVFTSKVELGTGVETAWHRSLPKSSMFPGEKSKSIWEIPKRPSTRRRPRAAGPSSAPAHRYVKRRPQRAKSYCDSRRRSSALPLTSSQFETEWSASPALHPKGYP